MSILYQDRNVRDKWLKNYIDEMNTKKELRQLDVINFLFCFLNIINS
jgi:hypothetical protein